MSSQSENPCRIDAALEGHKDNQRDGRIEGYQQQCMDAEQAPDREQTTTLSQDLGQSVGQQEDQPG